MDTKGYVNIVQKLAKAVSEVYPDFEDDMQRLPVHDIEIDELNIQVLVLRDNSRDLTSLQPK